MRGSMLILKAVVDVVINNGGIVRPAEVEDLLIQRGHMGEYGVTRNKVRSMFRELRQDAFFEFHGNYYSVERMHWMFFVADDFERGGA